MYRSLGFQTAVKFYESGPVVHEYIVPFVKA